MNTHAKRGIEPVGDNWLVELILPGIFTIILVACLAHLGYSAFQAHTQHGQGFNYAISAFAN